MNTTVISFFSDVDGNDYYSRNAKRVKEELTALGIPYHIEKKESLGSYQLNCLSKPQFILDTMNKLNQPVLWLDIDSKVHRPMNEFNNMDLTTDIAFATIYPFNSNIHNLIRGMKASPLYFGNSEGSKKFLVSWIEQTKSILESNSPVFDHEPLFKLFPQWIISNQLHMKAVGPEYCTWPGETNKDTIITMGLANTESKIQKLREMGLSEEIIKWQSVGD